MYLFLCLGGHVCIYVNNNANHQKKNEKRLEKRMIRFHNFGTIKLTHKRLNVINVSKCYFCYFSSLLLASLRLLQTTAQTHKTLN